MRDLMKYQMVSLAEPAASSPLPELMACSEEFTDAWIPGMRRSSRPDIHSLKTYFLDDLIVSGRGHAHIEGGLVTSPQFMPKYWRDILSRDPAIIAQEEGLPLRRIDDPCVVFMGHGERVYGHFLMEMLPRLEVARRCSESIGLKDLTYLVSSNSPMWLLNMLEDVGVHSSAVETYNPNMERVLLKQAILPVFASLDEVFHPHCTEIYKGLKSRILNLSPWGGDHLPPSRRLFLTRVDFSNAASERRSLIQAQEVADIARNEFDFEVVSPEALSWRDQISMFQSAKIIVGEAGSALHNAIFSPPGTVVGSLDFRNMMQWEIGALNKQQNSFLRCDKIRTEGEGGSRLSLNVDLFRAWMNNICETI